MSEIWVHFWRNGLTSGDNMAWVNYKRGGDVPSSLPGRTDTIDNIPRVNLEDIVYTS